MRLSIGHQFGKNTLEQRHREQRKVVLESGEHMLDTSCFTYQEAEDIGNAVKTKACAVERKHQK